MGNAETVEISADGLSLEDVVAVAQGAAVALGDDVVALMRSSRRVVDAAVARGDLVYGVTTGVGHARNEALPVEALASMQPMLLEMHVGATGDPLPRSRVRAGMVVRVNGFARGGAGVSPEIALAVVELLNHGIHPVIPSDGSVGAGDLGQLALVGRALLGRGTVEVDGRTMDAGRALDEAGVAPVTLQPKDGLAIMSSNALSIGHAALLVRELERLSETADLVVAASMHAFGANPSIVEPAIARAGTSPGQQTTADTIRSALRDTALRDTASGDTAPGDTASGDTAPGDTAPSADGMSVQDPLSFRVVPQVHGACRDALAALATAATAELNAASDNPLVDVSTGRIISNGNFQPMNLALAAESMRVALCHVGLLSERRMGHLWDAAVTSLGPDTAGPPGPPTGVGVPPRLAGLGLRYPAASRYTHLRHLANPITLDVPPLDLAVEDHATNVAVALAKTEEAAAILHELLVVEVLIAVAALGPRPPARRSGQPTQSLLGQVQDELDDIPAGTLPHDVHRRVSDLLLERSTV